MSPSPLSVPAFSVLVLSLALLAGCLGDEPTSSEFVAAATGGGVMTDWDYAATTYRPASAALSIVLDEATNNGTVTLEARIGNLTLTSTLDRFTHNADDFHSGGVAANFQEHGDSGVGNNLLPRMDLLIATWGPGELMVGDNLTVDYYTGSTVWDAHLMVTDTGIRHGSRHVVQKADGASIFDPATAGDAKVEEGDLEAHLVFTSTYLNASLAPANQTLTASLAPPDLEFSLPFDVAVANATILINVEVAAPAVGQYTFQLRQPGGSVLDTLVLRVPAQGNTGTLEGATRVAGPHVLYGETVGAPATVNADVLITYAPKPMWYFFFEDVTVNQRVTG